MLSVNNSNFKSHHLGSAKYSFHVHVFQFIKNSFELDSIEFIMCDRHTYNSMYSLAICSTRKFEKNVTHKPVLSVGTSRKHCKLLRAFRSKKKKKKNVEDVFIFYPFRTIPLTCCELDPNWRMDTVHLRKILRRQKTVSSSF